MLTVRDTVKVLIYYYRSQRFSLCPHVVLDYGCLFCSICPKVLLFYFSMKPM